MTQTTPKPRFIPAPRRTMTKAEIWLSSGGGTGQKVTLSQLAAKIGKTRTTVWTTVRGLSNFNDGPIREAILTALHEWGFADVTEGDLW